MSGWRSSPLLSGSLYLCLLGLGRRKTWPRRGSIWPAGPSLLGRAPFPRSSLAIFAVKLFGFGPFAGFIALSLGTIGFFAKLLAEDIENISPVQAEAIRATGANWFQWINYAIQPQVMPRMIGLSVYRLDINFRESAVIGIVGGGGIGATLNTCVFQI